MDTSEPQQFTLTVTAVSDSPVAHADSYVVDEGETLTVASADGVLENDTDADGDQLTAMLISGPAHGTLDLNPNGGFIYTHDRSETTSDRFTYQAGDGSNLSAVTTVSLAITPQNDTPEANNDAYSVPPGVTLTVNAARGVLANDVDRDATALVAILGRSPEHGELDLMVQPPAPRPLSPYLSG
jgi:VCBS repeat-containing protein